MSVDKSYVYANGKCGTTVTVEFEAAVNLMGEELADRVCNYRCATDQDFMDRYEALHEAKYGYKFIVN